MNRLVPGGLPGDGIRLAIAPPSFHAQLTATVYVNTFNVSRGYFQ